VCRRFNPGPDHLRLYFLPEEWNMKKFACGLFVITAMLGATLGAMFITQHAGLVSAALTTLKFEPLPGNPQLVGAPPQLKVTKATIDYLQKLQTQGKIIEVQNDGSLKIK
jgi:hypothetical protein